MITTPPAVQRWNDTVLWNNTVHWNRTVLWNNTVHWNRTVLWNDTVKWDNTVVWNNTVKWNAVVAVNQYAANHPVRHVSHRTPKFHTYAPVYKYVPKHRVTYKHTAAAVATRAAAGNCGGDLPSCYILHRESGGSLTAKNPSSTASGKWQFLDSTWQGYGGYAHASDAPESVQDGRARDVWNHGAGCSNWAVNGKC